jgi:hypothetical protein|tara:strand:- start:7592 stop:7996 length:405 start_codon:yes stop_codon:yes gene_type:complete
MKEENSVIAEYLELMKCPNCENCGGFKISPTGEYSEKMSSQILQPKQMRYHLDWNWLMIIIDKIESTKDDYHGYFGVYISSNGCSIQGSKLRPDISGNKVYFSQVHEPTKFESTYKCVIYFIKWYLENIKINEN